MKDTLSFVAIGLGFLLLVLSSLWLTLFPAGSSWTEEKAEHWASIQRDLHNMAPRVNIPAGQVQMHNGADLGQKKADYEKLKKENEILSAEFKADYDRPRTTARILKWTGISLAALGLIAWYAAKQAN